MSSLQNFRVDVKTNSWCCVFDAQLALSRYGLALALRLSEQLDVWQVRALWQMLDDSDYYLSSNKNSLREVGTNALPIFSESTNQIDQSSEILDEWQTARFQSDLMGRLCWLGYAVEESMIPAEVDIQLDQRFGLLAQSLEERWSNPNSKLYPEQLSYECARDALALTAALIRYKPFILTVCRVDRKSHKEYQEPELCTYLKNCGIQCTKADSDEKIDFMQSYLKQIFTNTGALELVYAAGLQLAALHIIAPKAYVMCSQTVSEDVTAPVTPIKAAQSRSEFSETWSGCNAFWYPLWA